MWSSFVERRGTACVPSWRRADFVVRGDQAVDVFPGEPKASDQALQEDAVVGAAARIGALGSGFAARILVTASPIALEPGDRVVLAGPGLHHYVGSREIASIATSHVPQVASGRLIDTARNAGAKTGISVQVIQYGEPALQESEALPQRPQPELQAPAPTFEQERTEAFPVPPVEFPISAEPTQDFGATTETEPSNAEIRGAVPIQLGVRKRLGGRAANHFDRPSFGRWQKPAAIAAALLATVWVWNATESGEDGAPISESSEVVASGEPSETVSVRPEARILPRAESRTSSADRPPVSPLKTH